MKELEKAENEAKIEVEAAKSELEATKLKAKGNKELLTPEYRDHARTGAITNNAKIYFGDAIRDVFPVMSAWMALGTLGRLARYFVEGAR